MIALNDFRRQWLDLRDDATRAFEETGASGWYVLGQEVREFEKELAGYWRLKHAVGVASGLDAIEIGLRTLGCRAGDKVLTTPISAFATTLAILRLGAVPVFVDTTWSGLIDLDRAECALRADPSIRYFVPVHLFGHALDGERLRKLSSSVAIVEDCAQSIGALWNGQMTGTAGSIAATSFYPTKNLGAIGDGGALLTDNAQLAAKASVLRDYGQQAKYEHTEVGYNSRLDELQAAILRRAALPRLERWTERRRQIAEQYLGGITNEDVRATAPAANSSCWHLFPVQIARNEKHRFMRHMQAAGVMTGEHYPKAIPDQPALHSCRFEVAQGGLTQARQFCASEVSLPIHPYLTDYEVLTIIEAANAWRP